ncbi:hypothetical protein Dda3937_02702 [Dickeya dadantii 3937]|uniref:Sporadically distributed protein, TIGR04141 family n=4 Tax=Dickeya dadantii TaxID=204038 RepID=E0SK11_DICD3|nr:DUF6119 family protein [Dickeya dadantii]ADM96757.1 hypothetical protein Dda3937_02702 [Dickeya dadantii 3937]
MEKPEIENDDNLKSQTLTIRLLKKDIPIENALSIDHGYLPQETVRGELYTDQSESAPPTWGKFLGDFSRSDLSELSNKHCSAVLFIEVPPTNEKNDTRIMALTFGYGHHALEISAFERNFGLKVTLSAVTRTELVSLDTATLDSTVFQRRIQASKKANFSGFGMNIERDLLRLAGGIPSDTSFASALVGKDALTITARTSPDDFLSKCSKALDLFYSNKYKNEFSFIDHITPVYNSEHKDYLDSIIFSEISSLVGGGASDLHMVIPEVTNPEFSHEISYYGAGFGKGTKKHFPGVDINDYISELSSGDFNSIQTFEEIRKGQYIFEIQNGEKNKKSKRKVYDCLVFEVEVNNLNLMPDSSTASPINSLSNVPADLPEGVYVLFSGNWYLVDKEFHTRIENSYLKYLTKSFLPNTKMKNERALILDLNKSSELLNLDQVKINPTGTSNANIEPCDFLSTKCQFIHLKDGESSGPISHLWNQGVVSAEAYLNDMKFRRDLNKEIKKRQREFNKSGFDSLLPRANGKLDTNKITVVFGVMRTPYVKTSQAGLPFFSKVSFRPVAQAIESMGYKVELHLIEKI